MSRLKLSYQITIIFTVAFIITSVVLGVIITNRLDGIYEDNIYGRLNEFAKVLRIAGSIKDYEGSGNIAFINYNSQDKLYETSDNISDYVDDDAVRLLINKSAVQSEYSADYKNMIDGKEIYYTVLNYQGFFGIQNHDVYIVLTDNRLKSDMVKTTTIQVFIASVVAFLIGYLVVIFWITRLVDDTKKISEKLKDIGKNHFANKISTRRKDEIGELADSIEVMRNMIIENEQNKQEIIQGVSHDLKTPVAVISSYTEALADDICDKDEAVSVIKSQCVRLDNKITQLLNLTRLGYIDINDSNVGCTDMQALTEEVVSLYSYQRDVKIELDLAEATFFGDYESWQIVLQNIMDNAIRYAKSKISIVLKKDMLSISNDGKPIDSDVLPKIFNAYEKSNDGKFGLGLSIVRRTVLLFSYDIVAENTALGVEFRIFKP